MATNTRDLKKPGWALPTKLVDEIDLAYFTARLAGMPGSKQGFVAELLRQGLEATQEATQELRSTDPRAGDAQTG